MDLALHRHHHGADYARLARTAWQVGRHIHERYIRPRIGRTYEGHHTVAQQGQRSNLRKHRSSSGGIHHEMPVEKGITDQYHPDKITYKRKRQSKKKIHSIVAKKRSFQAKMDGLQPTNIIQRGGVGSLVSSGGAANTSTTASFGVYSVDGFSTTGAKSWDDLVKLYAMQFSTNNSTPGNASSVDSNLYDQKFDITKAHVDIELCCVSGNAVVDCYYIVPKVDVFDADPDQALNNTGFGKMYGAGAVLTLQANFPSPFDFHQFCAKWTIIERRTIQMTAGQLITMEKTFHKPVHIDSSVLSGSNWAVSNATNFCAKKGLTKGWLFMARCLPNNGGSGSALFGPYNVNINYMKTYNVRLPYGGNVDASGTI